ncbi:hypothetical protein PYW07_000412 [Mythimna separata]|uniref:BPTI/Kunitz inhibitor domain-containing protein n=1 Tax=Mythimna separata TaxID=271217 RepID=A0AAD8E0I5_MYTSE|nr:hypothetical protein PYW07_000412 [Mythimna separata]
MPVIPGSESTGQTCEGALACWWGGGGGGGGGWNTEESDFFEGATYMNLSMLNATLPVPEMDEKFYVNLTGISDPLKRIILTSWNGWTPDNETQMDWRIWYDGYMACKEMYEGSDGKRKKKKNKIKVEPTEPLNCTKYGFPGSGGPGGGGSWGGSGGGPGGAGGAGGQGGSGYDYFEDDNRGPGSGWPNSHEWKGLGQGSAGPPIPPWAYVPKNIGKNPICYLSPTRGQCNENLMRWGFNPFTDRCQNYTYSGCGGTRNRFTTVAICEKHCKQPIEPSCSVDSGIKATNVKLKDHD